LAKILQVCAIDLTAEKLLLPLLTKITEEGHEVHTACADTGRMKGLLKKGFKMIHIPFKRKISSFANIHAMFCLIKLIKKEKYDIVHVHTPIAAALGRIAAKIAGVQNILYTAHGYYFHEGMSKPIYYFWLSVEKLLARFCTDYLLLQSVEDYELSRKEKFLPENRIIHLGNGIDVMGKFNPSLYTKEKRMKIRNQLGISPEELVVCFIGRLVQEKGIFELLKSFRSLKEEYKTIKLLVIGEAGETERDQSSQQQLGQLLNHPDVLALGFRNDIADLLYASDIFVLPSYREGLPRSIIEAMSMKIPVIATDIRGCREEVMEGKNGYLIPKRDSKALTQKLLTLVKDSEIRKNFGEFGRKTAVEQFNEQSILDKQMSLFKQIENSIKSDVLS
jgi:glycosyltransferase involved in cell wall biosynthesis